MDKNKVVYLLSRFNSFEYAVRKTQDAHGGPLLPRNKIDNRLLPANVWDNRRYTRIVEFIRGAINELLSDNERMVIMRKYLDRNKMSLKEIANDLNRDRGTISKWHTGALEQLCTALEPLDDEYVHISNLDHMFDQDWRYSESA
ncbi:sigma factor-like helix-turn-helix DNA-binding protein [Paenibacillus sp. DMB20]|uniref:sigma factor-like helix-turn-helix DNA-binding protein n=1 Tax=Paenibacillus sp. DMB20 TaxID=1642570 RepID=UPI00062762FE|nr:helix-turn-helix domain-containing protein [Paenibacillus sp. DMB20]KKO51138.1 hypothetical protein XI25_29570 [Paenibacillus sp. DMB20]